MKIKAECRSASVNSAVSAKSSASSANVDVYAIAKSNVVPMMRDITDQHVVQRLMQFLARSQSSREVQMLLTVLLVYQIWGTLVT